MTPRKVMVSLLALSMLILWMSPAVPARPGNSRDGGTVNINAASVEELVQLPRVGQKVAERIISYREAHGGFKKVEDIKIVQGIGDKVFEMIRPLISVK